MTYIFREKLNLLDLAGLETSPPVALVAESEEYLFGIYSQHLQRHNFVVVHCPEPMELPQAVLSHNPDILILNPRISEPFATLKLVTALKNTFPALPVVTIGDDIDSEQLKRLMSAGIVSHIDRRFSRPRDIIMIVKSIVRLRNQSFNY